MNEIEDFCIEAEIKTEKWENPPPDWVPPIYAKPIDYMEFHRRLYNKYRVPRIERGCVREKYITVWYKEGGRWYSLDASYMDTNEHYIYNGNESIKIPAKDCHFEIENEY
jgi:hypothetical protein